MADTPKQTDLKESEKRISKLGTLSLLKGMSNFKGWEMIWQMLFYGFVAWGSYALYILYQFHHSAEYAEVPKFSIYDFKLSIIPSLFFFIYKRVCLKLFYNPVKNSLDPAKFVTEEDRSTRATKNSLWLSSIIYYIFTSTSAYFLFKDAFFFPSLMGGSGQCSDIYKYTPYVPHVPYAVLFYQMQFGWHFHTLIDHIVCKWKDPKFWEMFLHHTVAVFLIFFSYLCNQLPVGILVLATHDPCDIGLYASRLYSDLKNKKDLILGVIFVFFTSSWMYLRLFVFPRCIVGQAFGEYLVHGEDIMNTLYLYLLLMMTALVALHLYWFIFIVRILVNVIRCKKDVNVYDNKGAKKTN
jgi:hypothetical protein